MLVNGKEVANLPMLPSGDVDDEPLVHINKFLGSRLDDLPLRTEEWAEFTAASSPGGFTKRSRATRLEAR